MSKESKKLQSEQQAICRISNNDIVCKDCVMRIADDVVFGNTTSCEQYPDHTKPLDIIFKGKGCQYYVKE